MAEDFERGDDALAVVEPLDGLDGALVEFGVSVLVLDAVFCQKRLGAPAVRTPIGTVHDDLVHDDSFGFMSTWGTPGLSGHGLEQRPDTCYDR